VAKFKYLEITATNQNYIHEEINRRFNYGNIGYCSVHSLLSSRLLELSFCLSSFLGSTAQLRPWPPPRNPAEFLGGFSTIFFFTG
jgi:hypothetical protein